MFVTNFLQIFHATLSKHSNTKPVAWIKKKKKINIIICKASIDTLFKISVPFFCPNRNSILQFMKNAGTVPIL